MSLPPPFAAAIPVRFEPSIAGKAPVSLDATKLPEASATKFPSTTKPPSALKAPGV